MKYHPVWMLAALGINLWNPWLIWLGTVQKWLLYNYDSDVVKSGFRKCILISKIKKGKHKKMVTLPRLERGTFRSSVQRSPIWAIPVTSCCTSLYIAQSMHSLTTVKQIDSGLFQWFHIKVFMEQYSWNELKIFWF